MGQRLKLPDELYETLREAARARGMAPEEWIAAQLSRTGLHPKTRPTAAAIARANARLRRHVVSSGRPGPCDNEQIDADLAREYGADLLTRHGRD